VAVPPANSSASHLPAALLFGTVALAAPSLFYFAAQLALPLFAVFFATAAQAGRALPGSWFTLIAPLLKLLGLLLVLATSASIAALSLRRALVR
jgi:hypothetical protein